jgi:hypothetical protein
LLEAVVDGVVDQVDHLRICGVADCDGVSLCEKSVVYVVDGVWYVETVKTLVATVWDRRVCGSELCGVCISYCLCEEVFVLIVIGVDRGEFPVVVSVVFLEWREGVWRVENWVCCWRKEFLRLC